MSSSHTLRGPVFYFRGLNTHGDEILRFGRLALGPMHGPWLQELKRRGLGAIAVTGRGGGPLEEQIQLSAQFIQQHPAWRDASYPVHFLAHSTGGLVARALVHELKKSEKIATVVTVATPHHGASFASLIAELPQRRPRLNQVMTWLNYRIEEKLKTFHDLTPEQMRRFNQKYPDVSNVVYGAAVFSSLTRDLSWPVRLARHWVTPSFDSLNQDDGIVAEKDQMWGKIWYQGQLDHMNQIGFNLRLNPFERRLVQSEFRKLVDQAVFFMAQHESP